MDNRQILVNELNEINKQAKKVREQIDALDYEERFNAANKFLGKFYKEISTNKNYIHCVHVYGINTKDCRNLSFTITNYLSDESDWFECNTNPYFKPDEDEFNKWEEITKDEFMKHYNDVMIRINKVVKNE